MFANCSSRPLPITFPVAANLAAKCGTKDHRGLASVIDAAMILAPCRFTCILVEITARDVMMRTDFHATKAAKETFGLVGASAVILEGNAVIDPARIPASV